MKFTQQELEAADPDLGMPTSGIALADRSHINFPFVPPPALLLLPSCLGG